MFLSILVLKEKKLPQDKSQLKDRKYFLTNTSWLKPVLSKGIYHSNTSAEIKQTWPLLWIWTEKSKRKQLKNIFKTCLNNVKEKKTSSYHCLIATSITYLKSHEITPSQHLGNQYNFFKNIQNYEQCSL